MELTLTLTTDFPFWVKETTTSFGVGGEATGIGFDLTHDFPYDFTSDVTVTEVNNPSFVPSNFRMVIYGACSKPSLMVGGHTYQVGCNVPFGGYLTIDSVAKKIYLTGTDGTQTNVFNQRNRDSYIFEKIQPGKSPVAWDGGFGFDIILLEERSEPKWT
jgi:phage-related protein